MALNCSDERFAGSDCHNHGVCQVVGGWGNATGGQNQSDPFSCVCAPGWTGRSDWVNYDDYGGGDCHLNQNVLYGLWGINLLLMLNAVRYGVKLLKKRLRSRAKTGKRGQKQKPRKKKPWYEDNTLTFVITELAATSCLCLLALFKIIFGQEQLVGRSPLVTLVYIIGRGCFYFSVNRAQSLLLKLSLGGAASRKYRDLVKKANKLAMFKFCAVDCMSLLNTLVCLIINSPGGAEITYIIKKGYAICGAIGLLFAVLTMSKGVLRAFGDVDKSKNDDIARIAAAMKKLVKSATKSAMINVPANASFLFILHAWGFWSYFLPIQFCLIPINMVKLCKSFMGRGKKGKRRKVAPGGTSASSENSSENSDGEDTTAGSVFYSTSTSTTAAEAE